MKTRYNHIHFIESSGQKEKYWLCCNNKTNAGLGIVEYYSRWRRWVFTGYESAIFDSSCLRDIADFLDQLKANQ